MTREEAIEKVKDMRDYIIREHSPNDVFISHMNEAIEALKEQRPQWISCAERLPNTNGIYIVTRIIEAHFIEDVSYFDGSNTWHADNRINHSRDYLKDVVAWMPLPEPYKEEGEAE